MKAVEELKKVIDDVQSKNCDKVLNQKNFLIL